MKSIALVIIAAALVATLQACASGPQLAATTLPQQTCLYVDAADGGTITIGGDVWQDARGQASSEQRGLDVEADVDATLETQVHP
jgi:hypothetical protein